MSPTLNGSSALQHFERSNAIEIGNGVMFDFDPGLPQICWDNVVRDSPIFLLKSLVSRMSQVGMNYNVHA